MRRLIVFSVIVCCSAISRAEAANSAVQRDPETVVNTFREPIVLESATPLVIGGVDAMNMEAPRLIQLSDATKQTITFCLDGRLVKPGSPPAQLFFGTHPRLPDAKAIPVGGVTEQRILTLLERWQAAGAPMQPPTATSASASEVKQMFEWQRKQVDYVLRTLQQRKKASQTDLKK